MRRSVRHALAPVLLVVAVATPARAENLPKVARGGCDIDATNGSASCVVLLDANPDGEFGQTTWDVDGYGVANLVCRLSGSAHLEGGYGSDWKPFPHGADVCTLTINASNGYADAYVT
ncbi:MAG: hypothetical protein QOE45_3316 [Frankiaceae bacterium]|nr:hypothetical protein [Frankiaceae bacterium]